MWRSTIVHLGRLLIVSITRKIVWHSYLTPSLTLHYYRLLFPCIRSMSTLNKHKSGRSRVRELVTHVNFFISTMCTDCNTKLPFPYGLSTPRCVHHTSNLRGTVRQRWCQRFIGLRQKVFTLLIEVSLLT